MPRPSTTSSGVKPTPLIDVANVSKIYRLGAVSVPALEAVSLQIAAGEMVCIMGKSGSGKSTLLRQLSLIDRPSSGRILLNGQEVTRLAERHRTLLRLSSLGYVFQEYALIPELTAWENVYLPAMMLAEATPSKFRERAHQLLEEVGLASRARHRPRELSGGEQQRVAIARALINDPTIVFADEPTANLDSISGATVMQTLTRLNRDTGVTVVFVSHDPDDGSYAGRLVQLRDGRLVPEDPPAGGFL
jgi:putative ABC transport system ATP-binding protein